jgi:hypothetical protein
MKYLFLFLLFLVCSCSKPENKKSIATKPDTFINPTGHYELESEIKQIGEDRYGYSGEIRVKLLEGKRIAVGFYMDKGAPSYNSGSFLDTLAYDDSIAIYRPLEFDSTCALTLLFSKNGVLSTEQTADYNSGCGFGHAVVANGFFKKISSDAPTELDPMTQEQ